MMKSSLDFRPKEKNDFFPLAGAALPMFSGRWTAIMIKDSSVYLVGSKFAGAAPYESAPASELYDHPSLAGCGGRYGRPVAVKCCMVPSDLRS
jgi:hypothetical protein